MQGASPTHKSVYQGPSHTPVSLAWVGLGGRGSRVAKWGGGGWVDSFPFFPSSHLFVPNWGPGQAVLIGWGPGCKLPLSKRQGSSQLSSGWYKRGPGQSSEQTGVSPQDGAGGTRSEATHEPKLTPHPSRKESTCLGSRHVQLCGPPAPAPLRGHCPPDARPRRQ